VAQDKKAYLFKGLQLFAMDGTTLRTHDTVESRDHFGAQGTSAVRLPAILRFVGSR
jgi:hypothetical protein